MTTTASPTSLSMDSETGSVTSSTSPFAARVTTGGWSGRRVAAILAASDGTERSDGALRIALARAEATNAVVEVLTVLRWEPAGTAEGMVLWERENMDRRAEQRRAVEEQLERLTGHAHSHPVTVLDGHPACTISRVAVERHAALVVVGLGSHGLADRIFSEETALQLARICRVPVLAVPEHGVGGPVHIVVAIDFGDLSRRAAQTAIEVAGDDGRVDLVHVMTVMGNGPFAMERAEREGHVRTQFAELMAELVAPESVHVTPVLLYGRPTSEVLAFAERSGADAIAVGTHGRGFVARTVLGSVATALLRGARCAVLSVPRDPLPALRPDDRAAAGPPAPGVWAETLKQFSRRNVGRRTILEVDDLELGAQAQEYNYPLLGTSYDARFRRVELSFGAADGGGRHLTRCMSDVRSVDVLTDGQGHDIALRVQHGRSHTLLTFAG